MAGRDGSKIPNVMAGRDGSKYSSPLTYAKTVGDVRTGFSVGGVSEVNFIIDGISYSGKEYAFLQKLNSIEEKLDRLLMEGN
jgi:hypothetical protein